MDDADADVDADAVLVFAVASGIILLCAVGVFRKR